MRISNVWDGDVGRGFVDEVRWMVGRGFYEENMKLM
jgi:hypothetical protein